MPTLAGSPVAVGQKYVPKNIGTLDNGHMDQVPWLNFDR